MKKGVGDEQISRWTMKRRQTHDRHALERKERLGRWRRMSEKRGMPPSISHEVMGPDAMILVSEC